MPYPWYELVSGPVLQQGDILRNCLAPVLPRLAPADAHPVVVAVPAVAEPSPPELFDQYDRVIILSQSCDLADGVIRRVMVCPAFRIDEFLKNVGGNKEKQNSTKSELKKGRRTAYHLLNACDLIGYEAPHLVADFGDAFSVPLEYAVELADIAERVRLLPPYREQLAQMFARFYMRVGLPIEVDPIG